MEDRDAGMTATLAALYREQRRRIGQAKRSGAPEPPAANRTIRIAIAPQPEFTTDAPADTARWHETGERWPAASPTPPPA
jgi:hypothetical protein